MYYAILSYDSESSVSALSQETHDAMMADLAVVRRRLAAEGRLGPVARLMPTTAATTVRRGSDQLVIDGPFAETKEALLGFYIVDCPTLQDAIDAAHQLMAPRIAAGLGPGALEIRPLATFYPDGV
jgi:hypothetical protein